jgi:voltage-dependent calcium channel L type alpha-1D
MKDISNFSVLLALFVFIYALLGMELFAYRVKFDENDVVDEENGSSPRTNFDEFQYAVITIFIVLIGEDWNNVMYAYVRATNSLAIAFFMSLMILGNLVLLNLFLAILLKNFEEEVIIDDEEIEEEEEEMPLGG